MKKNSIILKKLVSAFVDYYNNPCDLETDDCLGVWNAEAINYGDCGVYACLACELIPDAIMIGTRKFGGHVFLKIGSKYYDATHTDGVTSYKKIDHDFIDSKRTDFQKVDFVTLSKDWNGYCYSVKESYKDSIITRMYE